MTSHPRIHCHHVGGRGGTFSPKIPPQFAADYKVYSYEMDPAAIAQMEAAAVHSGVDLTVIPKAVGDRVGKATININADAYTSSVLTARGGLTCYQPSPHYDDIIADGTRTVRTVEVDMTTLDAVCAERGEPLDVLSLDAQGFEFDILDVSRAVERDTVMVLAEVSFIQLYDGQARFSMIANLMQRYGFRFERMEHWTDLTPWRAPTGWRGKPSQVHGDAMFVKTPKAILESHPEPVLGLLKLAFVAMTYGMVETAMEALERVMVHADMIRVISACDGSRYVRMLAEVMNLYGNSSTLDRPNFADMYDATEAEARFSVGGQAISRHFRNRYLSRVDRKALQETVNLVTTSQASPFENLLVRYGFDELANIVYHRRVSELVGVLVALGFAHQDGSDVQIDTGALTAELAKHDARVISA